MPGNAVDTMMAKFPNLTPQGRGPRGRVRRRTSGGLLHQYWVYLGDIIHFNLGTSVSLYPSKVATVIGNTLPWTIALVGTATVISFALGTLLGIFAGWRRDGLLDRALPAFTFLQATPYFFLALIVIEFFALDLHWFPLRRRYTLGLIPQLEHRLHRQRASITRSCRR